VNRWDNLTQEEVNAPSINSFKNHVGDGRWTSLWTNNWSSSHMAARFEKTIVINYLLKMHRLGAAAPGELPAELCIHSVIVVQLTDNDRSKRSEVEVE